MIDYRTPLADILFVLEHGADASRIDGWDQSLASDLLTHAASFVDDVIAPLDPIADREHAQLVNGRVKVPDAFVSAYAQFKEGGWPGLAMDEAHGGQGLPHVLMTALLEMLSGACVTFEMIISLAQGAARAISLYASEDQKQRYLPLLSSGEWLATMCLTEPQAGSDLGLIRTMATPSADGGYSISGGKIFISGGDQNMTENTLHLVLARSPDAPPGVKGLSLFLCPSSLASGERNKVAAVRLEEKMGMHSSPTCQMAFDGAWAEIVGKPGQGLAFMFAMMNAERLDVAAQGAAFAETALQRSLAYALERKQGTTGAGETLAIVRHADVRRMLLTQMAYALGCRAMIYRTMTEMELGTNPQLVEFMTPVCKAFCTDAGMEAAHLAIQIHGGYGYLKEYRVEQIVRDGRITQIYEGTNGIQAATLAGRLLRLENGALAKAFRVDIEDAINKSSATLATALKSSLADWDRAVEHLLAIKDTGLVADSFMRLTGLLAFGAAIARLEAKAEASANPDRLRAIGAFVAERLLPQTASLAAACKTEFKIGDLPDAVFEA